MADNGRSATDIITYIGVPLAVLGVLPIMYNTFVTLVNASKIKRMLRHSRLTALTRSDVVNRVIEIELPRYAVTPWDRFRDGDAYWTVARTPSAIPGGSWTTFNWKTNAIGFKTQRVEYADQLRQPQVDVAFDELVAYLLDLGAVPDAHGWRLLRSTGLWTPVGCALMRSPDGLHPALSLAPLDDSDGNLSLAVTWQPQWTIRSVADLPPYWVSLPAPPPDEEETKKAEQAEQAEQADEPGNDEDLHQHDADEAVSSSSRPASADALHADRASLRKGSFDSSAAAARDEGAAAARMPITCQLSADGIITALTEDTRRAGGVARHNTMGTTSSARAPSPASPASPASLWSPSAPPTVTTAHSPDSLYIEHLRTGRAGRRDGVWFASAATAYGTTSQTILWNYRIPEDLLAFARRATVPCGVLVLLGLADESETPEWATQHEAYDRQHDLEQFMQRTSELRLAQQAEARLSPQQRAAAQRDREQRETMQRLNDMRMRSQRARERAEQREMEALHSAVWDPQLVAEHALRWLQRQGAVAPACAMRTAGGHLLHRMVRDGQFAARVCAVLDRWKAWADLGGMKKADVDALRADRTLFAQAALLLALIKDSASALEGTLSVDLQECMRIWRKVRLG